MGRASFLRDDGRALVIALDRIAQAPSGDRGALIQAVAAAGADAVIANYGIVRDIRTAFGNATPILRLDITTGDVGQEHVQAWTIQDALRLRVKAVLTSLTLGAPGELQALRLAGEIAAACDREGLTYVCDIAGPDVGVAARVAAELGAHVISARRPAPADGIAAVVACGVPVLVGDEAAPLGRKALLAQTDKLMAQGAAGVVLGPSIWSAAAPGNIVASLSKLVHAKE